MILILAKLVLNIFLEVVYEKKNKLFLSNLLFDGKNVSRSVKL